MEIETLRKIDNLKPPAAVALNRRKGVIKMSTTEITAKLRNLKELQALIEEANAEAEAIKDELKALMIANKTEEMTVDVYKVKYTTVTSCRFDSAAFKKTHGDLYAQYSKPTVTRRFSVA